MRIQFAAHARNAVPLVVVRERVAGALVDPRFLALRADPHLHLVVIGRIVELRLDDGFGRENAKDQLVFVKLAGAARKIVVPDLAEPNVDAPLTAGVDVVGRTVHVLQNPRRIAVMERAGARAVENLVAGAIVGDVLLVRDLVQNRIGGAVPQPLHDVFKVPDDVVRSVEHRIVAHVGPFDLVIHLRHDLVDVPFDR